MKMNPPLFSTTINHTTMKQTHLLIALLFFAISLPAQQTPKEKLIYCSYADEGVAQLGTNYCELVADIGTTPKVVVVKDKDCHFAEEKRGTYEINAATVAQLQEILERHDLDTINGYRAESYIEGGHEYRIHMEYDSGKKIHASWHTHEPMGSAVAAYDDIKHFFAPWVEKLNAGITEEKAKNKTTVKKQNNSAKTKKATSKTKKATSKTKKITKKVTKKKASTSKGKARKKGK